VSFDTLWDALAPIGRVASGGYRRFAWTPVDAVLREWFASEARTRRLDVVTDRAGNQWAWWGSPGPDRPGVAVGSHLDSVPDGGSFDGPLGVVSAFCAVDLLRSRGFMPARPVGIACFGDEEGARFGVACAGSRLLTGALPADHGLALVDGDGVSMATAMRAAGLDPSAVGPDEEALRLIAAFIELHVEQGRGLVDLRRPIAVGSSILAHGRWRLDLTGEANHAGTTRLEDRRDPMIDLAAAVSTARSAATARACVATIGKVAVVPNGVNAIPSAVTAWLDARGDAARAVAAEVGQAAGTEPVEESYTPDTRFDPTLVTRLSRLLGSAPVLGTGAGHDAGILAAAGVPAAMLFVRNPTGVSHSPAEHAEREDCLVGVEALAAVIADLAG
jgi:beta-ureidopropionase / N-carbamoyl-L-amino-acid hydrolase